MGVMQIREPTSHLLLWPDETLRSASQKRGDELEVPSLGVYCLIPDRRLLLAGQDQIELGSRAFDILALLLKRRGAVVSSRQILEHVWPGIIVEESNIRGQISRLRQAFKRGASNLSRRYMVEAMYLLKP